MTGFRKIFLEDFTLLAQMNEDFSRITGANRVRMVIGLAYQTVPPTNKSDKQKAFTAFCFADWLYGFGHPIEDRNGEFTLSE
jgi:hypothetical protein